MGVNDMKRRRKIAIAINDDATRIQNEKKISHFHHTRDDENIANSENGEINAKIIREKTQFSFSLMFSHSRIYFGRKGDFYGITNIETCVIKYEKGNYNKNRFLGPQA